MCQYWDNHLIYWAVLLTTLLTCPNSDTLLCYNNDRFLAVKQLGTRTLFLFSCLLFYSLIPKIIFLMLTHYSFHYFRRVDKLFAVKLWSTLGWHYSRRQCLSRRSFLSQKWRRIYPFLARTEGVGERRRSKRLDLGAVLDDELLLLCTNSELVSVSSAIANWQIHVENHVILILILWYCAFIRVARAPLGNLIPHNSFILLAPIIPKNFPNNVQVPRYRVRINSSCLSSMILV